MKPNHVIMLVIILCGVINVLMIRWVVVERKKYMELKKWWDKIPRATKKAVRDN